jgi:DNA polymerase III delta prime subunit
MFFDSVSEILEIAQKCGTVVFVVPKDSEVAIKNALVLKPEEKQNITIDQVRNLLPKLGAKQQKDIFVIIRPAELLQAEAANALLKKLEEPNDKVHFLLITDEISQILPTILSRSAIYILKNPLDLKAGICADEKVKNLAKKLMVAKGAELIDLAEKIAKKKDGVRGYALEILGVAIEMLYKTYLITGKEAFLKKLPKFLQAYESIAKNGHIKLQIVANLC